MRWLFGFHASPFIEFLFHVAQPEAATVDPDHVAMSTEESLSFHTFCVYGSGTGTGARGSPVAIQRTRAHCFGTAFPPASILSRCLPETPNHPAFPACLDPRENARSHCQCPASFSPQGGTPLAVEESAWAKVPDRKGIQRRRGRARGAAVTGAVLIACLASCQEGGPLPGPPPVPDIALDAEVAAAVEHARTEVETDRRNPTAWMRLGMTFAANELPQQAAATYETAAQLAAEDPKAWYHLGLARARTGALAPAIEALGRAGRLDTSYAPLAWRRGFFRLETGDLAGAGQDFRRARRLDPEDVAGTTGLARLALQQGEAGTAAALLESLTARQPREPYYHQLLGRAYLALGSRQEAEAAFRRGKGGSMPRFDDPWERETDQYAAGFAGRRDRALAAFAEGRLPDAIEKLRALLEERPGDGSLSYALAVACMSSGRAQEAVRVLERRRRN